MSSVVLALTVALMAAVTWTWYVAHLVLQEIRWLRRVLIPWMNGLSKQVGLKGELDDH